MALRLKTILSISFVLLVLANADAQGKADSLLNVIATAKTDSNMVNTYMELAADMLITRGDYDKAIFYSYQAIEVSKKVNFKKGQAKAHNLIGAAYMLQGKYQDALNSYYESVKIKEDIGDKKGIASTYSNIGLVSLYQGQYVDALNSFNAALEMEKEINDKAGIAGSYNNIGIVYEDLGNYPMALKNYQESIKIKEELGDKKGLANSYHNMGSIKETQKFYRDALEYHIKALKIRMEIEDKRGISESYNNIGNIFIEQKKYPMALKSHLSSLKTFQEIGNNAGIATSYNSIGEIYFARGDSAMNSPDPKIAIKILYPTALENFFLALQIRKEIGDQSGVASTYINIGKTKIKLNQLTEAKTYLSDGLQISQELGNIKIVRDGYFHLSALDSVKGDFRSAFEDHKKYILFKDSLHNEEKVQQTAQLQNQYETEQKLQREAYEREQLAEARSRRLFLENTIITLTVFTFIGLVMLVARFRIPPVVARGLNFVSLLLVFESVLVFLDPKIDDIIQGSQMFKLVINIALAVIIFPIHNLLERKFKKKLKIV